MSPTVSPRPYSMCFLPLFLIGCGKDGEDLLPPTPPVGSARVTVTTTGQSLDSDGYRVIVDGSEVGDIGSNGTVLAWLEPGSHMIGLTGLALNCAVDGPGSRTVTILATEVVPVEFAVVCTGLHGVIKFVLSGALGLGFEGILDGVTRIPIGNPVRGVFTERGSLAGVPAGIHVVSLSAPPDCTHSPGQFVTMPPGDTVEVTFSVTCVSGLRITTRTTGPIPLGRYTAFLCSDDYCDAIPFIGHVAPNGSLVFKAGTDTYEVGLSVPSNCVRAQSPPDPIRFVKGTLVDVEFSVVCS